VAHLNKILGAASELVKPGAHLENKKFHFKCLKNVLSVVPSCSSYFAATSNPPMQFCTPSHWFLSNLSKKIKQCEVPFILVSTLCNKVI